MKKDHRSLRRRPIFLPLLAPAMGGIVLLVAMIWLWHANEITTVFVVRHADIQEGSDPLALSSTGLYRAKALGGWLRKSGLQRIYVSDFGPARETAAAVSDATGAQIVEVATSDTRALVRQLRRLRGDTVLVVARREIIPDIVDRLGGFRPGLDESDYSDLIIVTDSLLTRAKVLPMTFGG